MPNTAALYKIGITDQRTGETKIFRNAEDGCAGANRDSFPSASPPGEGPTCRANRSRGCYLDSRFAVD
jgi:hypothetical protein